MELRAEIERLIDKSGADCVGVTYYDLQTGKSLLINADVSFHAASTMKVPVMMELFHQAEEGLVSLDESIDVRNEFKSIVDGSPYSLGIEDDSDPGLYEKIGQPIRLIDLCETMITRSSNLATNLLIDRLGAENVDRSMIELGATGLVILRGVEDGKAYRLGMNNLATAMGLMTIMTQLALGLVVSYEASDQMIQILRRQEHRNCIPARLPANVKVGNKTGWNSGVCHDVAIVDAPEGRSYVLAVLTRGLEELEAAPALIAAISRLIYEAPRSG